jgi:two-component system OmpR family sensor kinase
VSLRVRLLLAVGAVALVALAVADVATYQSLKSFLYSRVDQSLDSATRALFRPGPFRDDDFVGSTSGLYIERRFADGTVRQYPGHLPGGSEFKPKLPTRVTASDPIRNFTAGPARARAVALDDGGQLILALPLEDAQATLHRLLAVELLVTLGALGAAAALGWSLVRVGLQPLAEVEETAEAIAEGDLDRRVAVDNDSTEVGRLGTSFNTMLERIQEAFAERDATEARLRRFVADASHELRTPVAAVSAYAELFDRGASTRPDDLERVMTGIRAETARMGELVQDLLLLARLDEGRPLERAPVEIVALAAEAVDAAMTVGPAWPVRLDAAGPVEITGDRARLRQVFDNLLGNIRTHTPAGTAAVVTIAVDGPDAVITVADQGPGLSEEQRARVFERFYRAEASRSRVSGGGSGLGLAIVAAIVDALGGSVTVAAPPEGGASFTVRLPQADVEASPSEEDTNAPRSDAIRK